MPCPAAGAQHGHGGWPEALAARASPGGVLRHRGHAGQGQLRRGEAGAAPDHQDGGAAPPGFGGSVAWLRPGRGDSGPGTAGTAGCRSGEGGCPWEATQASVPSLPPGDLVCGLGSQAPSSASSRLSAGGGVGGEVSVLRGRAGTNVAGGRGDRQFPDLADAERGPTRSPLLLGEEGVPRTRPVRTDRCPFSLLWARRVSDSVPAWLDLLPEIYLILQTIELVKNGHRGLHSLLGLSLYQVCVLAPKHAFLKPHQFDYSESPQLLPYRDS